MCLPVLVRVNLRMGMEEYDKVQKIGSGAMGTAWLVRRRVDGFEVHFSCLSSCHQSPLPLFDPQSFSVFFRLCLLREIVSISLLRLLHTFLLMCFLLNIQCTITELTSVARAAGSGLPDIIIFDTQQVTDRTVHSCSVLVILNSAGILCPAVADSCMPRQARR